MFLIRTAVNRVNLKCQSIRWNSKFSVASELYFKCLLTYLLRLVQSFTRLGLPKVLSLHSSQNKHSQRSIQCNIASSGVYLTNHCLTSSVVHESLWELSSIHFIFTSKYNPFSFISSFFFYRNLSNSVYILYVWHNIRLN